MIKYQSLKMFWQNVFGPFRSQRSHDISVLKLILTLFKNRDKRAVTDFEKKVFHLSKLFQGLRDAPPSPKMIFVAVDLGHPKF